MHLSIARGMVKRYLLGFNFGSPWVRHAGSRALTYMYCISTHCFVHLAISYFIVHIKLANVFIATQLNLLCLKLNIIASLIPTPMCGQNM